MDIRLMIKQLRNAADSLENLLIIESNQNSVTAKKILRGPYNKKKKKLHWTQTPKGRKIMSERMKAFRSKK